MSIESFEDLQESMGSLTIPPLENQSESFTLELFRILSKELDSKNMLIKELIKTIVSNNKQIEGPDDPVQGLSDLVPLIKPFLASLAAGKIAENEE